ncbi:Uncharacterised protein [Achromobacter xylosoxidans]|nr:hypothetical protein [Pseudomonas aeruginosa]CUI48935.1 Uncharacterised protein [Achromobacter xylosoxidans]CUK06608.1 Uncharacterised protein [Achromobacter xylosoxidans]CUR68871.1 hypothetical protein BN2877_43080 [Achromobacter xylosoxidans]
MNALTQLVVDLLWLGPHVFEEPQKGKKIWFDDYPIADIGLLAQALGFRPNETCKANLRRLAMATDQRQDEDLGQHHDDGRGQRAVEEEAEVGPDQGAASDMATATHGMALKRRVSRKAIAPWQISSPITRMMPNALNAPTTLGESRINWP